MADPLTSSIHYVPMLRGRAGELRALREIDGKTASHLIPLIEVPLIIKDSDSDESDSVGVSADLSKFAADLKKSWSSDRRVIFDASGVPADRGSIPTVDLINAFAHADYLITPTVRPSDFPWVVDGIASVIGEWSLNSACIRLGGDDLDDNDIPLAESIDQLLGRLHLQPANVDLVLDFGPVQDERAMSFAARIARLVLGELPHTDSWRTLVCAAGAFPPDLNAVQPEVLSEVPRLDAGMWNSLAGRARGRVPIFGDYAIAYPAQSAGAAFAPAPQLRFTADENWLVIKGRRQDRRGAAQFFDLCARVVDTEIVDASLSWGDDYVLKAARSEAKTGNAMIWRAIGTSHHLAYVTRRLATVGAP